MVLKIILCIFIPPVAAFMQVGATKHFYINLLLWIITCGIGALIHGLWLVLKDIQADGMPGAGSLDGDGGSEG